MQRRILVFLLAGGLLVALLAHLRPASFTTEDVRWTNGEVELAGTLYLPRSGGPHPAAVFLHGVGAGLRTDAIYRAHGERLAAEGVALLVYDKRGCGESTGALAGATFAERAADALAGVQRLRADPRIRADAVGLFGSSQGASVALLAASLSASPSASPSASLDPGLAFVATLSLSPRSPADHERAWREARAHAGEPPDPGLAALLAREARGVDGSFEPTAALAAVRAPVFVAQGEDDSLVPGPEAASIFRGIRRPAGSELTVLLVPGAEHTLRDRPGHWPEAYWRPLVAWLHGTLAAKD